MQRLAAGRAGRSSDDPGDHGPRRGHSRRAFRGRLSRASKIRRQLAAGTAVQTGDVGGDAGAEAEGVGKSGEGGVGER
jgi:hypothetical protein